VYEAYDALLSHFLDRTAFPSLVTLVVAGFSRGGQLVHRYATLRPTGEEDRVKYWIGAPASFVYLNDSRPERVRRSCDAFDEWKYGLQGVLPAYANSSGVALTQAGLAPRFVARRMAYLVGARDRVDGDPGCEADAQGK
jgi:pimeloyl-ACP methyl ester carboxylesterase